MKRIALLTAMVLTVCIAALGQRKFQKVSAADFDTPAEANDTTVDAVFIYEMGMAQFRAGLSSFQMHTTIKARIHILTEEGKEYANKVIQYRNNSKSASDDNEQISNIEATSYNLVDGKVVKTNMPSKYVFKEKVDDNYMQVKFSIPNVKVGTIIEYEYMLTSPRFTELPSWQIQHKDPVRYSYCSILIPDWYTYHIEQRGSQSTVHKSEPMQINVPTSQGMRQIAAKTFSYETENVPPFKHEGFLFCPDDYIQRIDFELISASIPGILYKTYTQTWDDVREFLKDKGEYAQHLKIHNPYAAEMATLGLEGQPASVKASKIFAFLKSKLKWNKKYALGCDNPLKAVKAGKGSNAELNFIYMAMLRDAGVKATPLLARGRQNGRLPITHASIDKLNTFIVAIADDSGALLFADCSADYGDVNVLPLTLLAEGVLYDPTLPTNPVSAPTRGEIYDLSAIGGNESKSRIDCIIDNDRKMQCFRRSSHTGINALLYKNSYHAEEDSIAVIEEKEKALGCKITTFKVVNADGPGRLVEERMKFSKDPVIDGGNLYINPLILADEKKNHFKQTDRELPVEFPVVQTTRITTNITIPDGYVVETMPQNQKLSMDGYMDASISFEMVGNVLVTKYESNIDNTFIPKEKYQQLQEYWTGLLKMNSMMVCLKKM